MIEISIRFLGGLGNEKGYREKCIVLPEGSEVVDLKNVLLSLDINYEENDLVCLLDEQVLAHYPENHPLSSKQVLAIFPMISGGGSI
jgi:molybdopterin converting factor small subunit